MKLLRPWRLLFLLPLLVFGGGCATHALWTETTLDAWNEPADDPALRLYRGQHTNLLVVYNEYSERHDSIRARAYELPENRERTQKHRRPRFVNDRLAQSLQPIPVFCVTNSPDPAAVPAPYAILARDNHTFTLMSDDGTRTVNALPVYNDGGGRVARLALTPIAVVADTTIVGGVIGYAVLAGMAESHSSYTWSP